MAGFVKGIITSLVLELEVRPMPSDPVPLVRYWLKRSTGENVQGYLAESVDLALAAKDETIAQLTCSRNLANQESQQLQELLGYQAQELAAVRQQLADAQQAVVVLRERGDMFRSSRDQLDARLAAVYAEMKALKAEQQQHARDMDALAAHATQYENDREYNASLCEELRSEVGALRARLAHVETIQHAAQALVQSFERMKARQHELLVEGQTLETASANWDAHPEAFSESSIDFQPLIDALAHREQP